MRVFSGLSQLCCSRCSACYDHRELIQMCDCGAPLFADYDWDLLRAELTKEDIRNRAQSLWRYHELLPVMSEQSVVTLREMMTPIIPLVATGRTMGMQQLAVKDESVLPTGTFKARGAAVGVSRARELGVRSFIIPTNGNAGAAWAVYAARAGLRAIVTMPEDAPVITRKECLLAGADVRVVAGTIADAGVLAAQLYGAGGIDYDASTLKEPYRLEGKKTMGFEIAEQFGWSVPDVIVYPTGGGAGVIGIDKALRELRKLGWIGEKTPRMVVVQAQGCSPLVRAFDQGARESEFFDHADTIAFGMRVPKAIGDFLILDLVRRSGGTMIAVSDEEISRERQNVMKLDGLHVCPEGAAALAGVRKLREMGWLRETDTVLSMNTGSGLKYMDQVSEGHAD
ncbi:MAG: threonine synthase [Bacilli bacterium]